MEVAKAPVARMVFETTITHSEAIVVGVFKNST